MTIQGNVVLPGDLTRSYSVQPAAAPTVQKEDLSRRFDSVTISTESGRGAFELELRVRLSQEVRTATSSGMIAELREQVRSGAYQVDAKEIARKMLLLGAVG